MTSKSTSDRQPWHSAFVGRDRELAELRAGLDDVGAGQGRLFLLSGEPGIGKTRLAEEISNDASARGMRAVWGRCWEGGGAPAYWPFIQILRACTNERDGEHLEALLGSGASEIARLIPELKLSLPSLEEAKAATDAESARFLLFDSVATLLKNVARREPLLLVVDDLHDADQPTLRMLRFIARETKDARLLIVGTYRDVEVRQSPELGKLIGDLIREGRTVSIAGLSQGEVGEFIERSAAKKADDKLVANLYQATDGNPLFVDGVVRLLAAEGKLERIGSDRRAFKIPDGVRESIRRRLAALSDEANSMLSIASVIGNEFDTRLLALASGRSPEQMVERIDEAARIGILKTEAPGFARQQFSHALIREVLYDDLAANRRIELHGEIGAAIEEIHKGDLRPHWAQLAHHFRAAGVAGKAIDYSIDAGEAAYRIFAYEDASLSWQTALRLMEEHNTEPQNQARLLERLGTLMYVTNLSSPKGMEYLARALWIYEETGQIERAALMHSRMGAALAMRSAIANPPDALEHYRKAEAILRKGADSRSKANLYAGMAMAALQLMLHQEGLAWSQAAMDISDRIGNEEIWINAACLHALHLANEGRVAQALTMVDEASNRADRLVDAASVYGAAMNSASLRLTLLDPTEAPFWLLRELAKPRLVHVTAPRLLLLQTLIAAYIAAGDPVQAKRVWEELDSSSAGRAVNWLFATGEFEQAEISLTRELELSKRAGSRDEEGEQATKLARIRRVLGDLAGAERFGRLANEKHKREGLPGGLHSGPLLAEIYAEIGDPGRAHPLLARCREILGNGEDWRGLTGKVVRAEAVVAAVEGKYDDAEAQFKKAVEIFRRYHVPLEEAEALHYWGRALNAFGEHGRANDKLDAAIEIYRRCGAGERWVQRVEADRPSSPARTKKGEHPSDAHDQAIFSREGDYWTIAYEGKTARLKDAKGLHYIAHLIAHPGEEIRALDLVTRIGGGGEETAEKASAEDLSRSDTATGDLGHAGEILDAQAKAAYQRRLSELEEEIEEAREFKNEERIAKAEDEKEALGRELRGAIGLAGRDRRSASATERGRIAVTKAIRLSLNKIAENDPSLGKLLSTTIKTGTVCAYVPDDRFPVSWRL
jgi:tetratricopeptide (TPR) repeat protein